MEQRLDPRLCAAVTAGRVAGLLSRKLGAGGGTTIPGRFAVGVDPDVLTKLVKRLPRGSAIVTGTNGKTTTSRLIASILTTAGWRPVHNRAGANLLSGVTSALVNQARPTGQIAADVGLFEVDEAVMPAAVERARPRVVVLTNLFRDQLDRYGEVDYLAGLWRKALATLPATSTIVLNADDPLVASLGRPGVNGTLATHDEALGALGEAHAAPGEGIAAKVVYFGVDDARLSIGQPEHAADSTVCLACGTPYEYSVVYYGHVGIYRCPRCHQARPRPDVSGRLVELDGVSGVTLTAETPAGPIALRLSLPGLYNAYNALAATAAALALGMAPPAIEAGIASFTAAFGRVERIQIDGKTAFLALVKNPVGFNQVIRTVFPRLTGQQPTEQAATTAANEAAANALAAAEAGTVTVASPDADPTADLKDALILINDNYADGTDISWLWDVDFELLRGRVRSIVVGGTRAEDMLVRLKYAGLPTDRLVLAREPEAALRAGLERLAPGDTLYVLPTYTAMLEVRAVLGKWHAVDKFWEN